MSAVLLALVPTSSVYADEVTPTPTPSATSSPTPEPTATPAPTPSTPEEKLEDGLAVDGGTVRAIVELTDPAQNAPVASKAAADSVDVLLQPRSQPFVVVEGTAEELEKLAADSRITSIHRDRAYPPTAAENLKQIGADQAHAQGFTGTGQAVAVLDTGIDRDHPNFGSRIVDEACFSAVDAGVQSLCPNGQTQQTGAGAADAMTAKCIADGTNLCDHGTHVAGIAAGEGGVAPGADIIAIQVFSRVDDESICGEPSCLLAYESSLRLAMDYVAASTRPIAAVNLSLGGAPTDAACDADEEGAVFKQKIDALLAKGIATVVAAGNEYFEGVSFPACISSTVAVGANNDTDQIADFSNRSALLDLFAPGVDIQSSVPDNQTAVYSGTSMAAPHVAGALALLKAQSPDADMTSLVDKLKSAGRPYSYTANGGQVTTPRLDVLAALTGGTPQPTVSQTADPSPDPDTPDDPAEPEPDPTDSSGPTPEPEPSETETAPTPVPLPTLTVTVTVTVTPQATVTTTAAPVPVCTRGTTAKRLTVKQWAVEIHRSSGAIPDATLACYLSLVSKSSKVFPELTKASSLGTAYKVLKAKKTNRQKLDAALLTGWLNWAHGTNGTSTLKASEKVRLTAKSTSAALKRATKSVLPR